MTGRYGTGELGVSVLGLAGNGLPGAAARWTLARGVLRADGTAYAEAIPGLDIRATTAEGRLVLDSQPVAGAGGLEPAGRHRHRSGRPGQPALDRSALSA